MPTATQIPSTDAYSSTVRKVLMVNSSGSPDGFPKYANYESKQLSPGASATDYDVKVTGIMFGTVTTSRSTTITNNDATHTLSVKLNATTNNIIVLKSGQSITINVLDITNIFLTTGIGFASTVDVIIFG